MSRTRARLAALKREGKSVVIPLAADEHRHEPVTLEEPALTTPSTERMRAMRNTLLAKLEALKTVAQDTSSRRTAEVPSSPRPAALPARPVNSNLELEERQLKLKLKLSMARRVTGNPIRS
jgi:hypothetical protein